jgi:[protein-PII] uridylyltransferase
MTPVSAMTMETSLPAAAAQLKLAREQIVTSLWESAAPMFLEEHTRILDDYFIRCYEMSQVGQGLIIGRRPYALIALGGYGRSEQCLYSDVDLLFLFEKKVPPEAEALVREIVYPLWDLGLEVGHATRSIKECIGLAAQDFEVLTSLLDARFICGMSPLFSALMEKVRSRIINLKPARIVTWLIETNRGRHAHFGDSSFLLEPNLKEGQGGLRDYHTMLWIARIKSDIRLRRDLEFYGYLSHDEYGRLISALSFIWQVRNRLHRLLKKKWDQLHLEHQAKLAQSMNFEIDNGHVPVERFLGTLHGHMEFIKERHEMFLYDLEQLPLLKRKNKLLPETDVEGLKFNRGMLNFVSPAEILKNPRLLLAIFLESAVKRAPLNAEAKRLVSDFLHLVDYAYRSSPLMAEDFENLLIHAAGAYPALSDMLTTGFLSAYIPQFKDLVNRIQFDQYHLYPVARHLLLTVRILKNFGAKQAESEDPLGSRLYREIKNRRVLIWAALLHDIGKADPKSGHSERGARMARSILEEKGLKPAEVDAIEFLIEEHLLLAKTATRRDLNDEETAIMVARRIRSIERLKMLYLMTVADSMATGPKAWNDWTLALFRDLFFKVFNILEKGELASGKAVRTIEKKKKAVLAAHLPATLPNEMEKLFGFLPPRYLLFAPADLIVEHLGLYLGLKEQPFVWTIEKGKEADTRKVTICTKDRPGLIAKIAGVFTLNSINILQVQIFTWRNKVAMDIFEVTPPPDPLFETDRWQRAATQLSAALAGELDLSAELLKDSQRRSYARPTAAARASEIVIDNEGSSFFTIIEVYTDDFPGLLYRITDALFRCRLDVWVAKIATRVDQVVDVFYVRDFEGEKVDDPHKVAVIKETLLAMLPDAGK